MAKQGAAVQFLKLVVAIVLVYFVVRLVTVTFFCKPKGGAAAAAVPGSHNKPEFFADLTTAFNKMSTDAAAAASGGSASNAPVAIDTDLLPKTTGKGDEDFSEFAPKALGGQNFLDAAKFVGVDTVGQTLKNANYQLRADVPNPRQQVSIWSQSTIEPDVMRRPLE